MMIISGRQTMSSSSLSASTLDIEVVKDHLARTRKSTMLYKCRRRKSFSYTRPRPFSDKSRLYYSPPWCLPLRFEGETGEPFVGIMYVMFLSKTVLLRRLRCQWQIGKNLCTSLFFSGRPTRRIPKAPSPMKKDNQKLNSFSINVHNLT